MLVHLFVPAETAPDPKKTNNPTMATPCRIGS